MCASLTEVSLKDKFFNTNPNTVDDLKDELQQQMFPVSTKALQALLWNFMFLIRCVISQEEEWVESGLHSGLRVS